MDLLSALPEEIFSEIATYFDSNDVLSSSLVSKGWYRMFGASKECMQKLVISYTKCNYRENYINALMKSERNYQRLIIGLDHSRVGQSVAEKIIKSILKKFSKSIIQLHSSHDFHRVCDLPKLKELTFKNYYFWITKESTHSFCTRGLLTKCTNLKKLEICCGKLDKKSENLLIESFKNMPKLKSLKLNHVNILPQLQTDDNKFRLEELDLNGYSGSSWTHIAEYKIMDFLKIHKSSLKVIRIDKMKVNNVFFFMSEFPKMHTLQVRKISSNYNKNMDVKLPINTSLKKLIIACVVPTHETRNKMSEMLTNCRNLKELKVHLLHVRFISILRYCKFISKVEYCFLSKYTPPDLREYVASDRRIKFVEKPYSCT